MKSSAYPGSSRPPSLVREWVQGFRKQCRSHGVRLTPQRLAVYETLARDPHHPSAESLYAQLRRKFPMLSIATVYRILEAFERQGFIRRVKTEGSSSRYDANLESHQHLVCRVCGMIEDARVPEFVRLPIPPRPRRGFELECVDVHLLGRCAQCRPGLRGTRGNAARG